MVRFGLYGAGLRALATRPHLWPTAARVVRRTARRGWWHRRPLLPVPSSDYVRFRLLTQYGDAEAVPTASDIVHYLEWCRESA